MQNTQSLGPREPLRPLFNASTALDGAASMLDAACANNDNPQSERLGQLLAMVKEEVQQAVALLAEFHETFRNKGLVPDIFAEYDKAEGALMNVASMAEIIEQLDLTAVDPAGVLNIYAHLFSVLDTAITELVAEGERACKKLAA